MLYERWRHFARERRAELALRDLANGQHWTFEQLAAATEGQPVNSVVQDRIAFPQGTSAAFVFQVLQAWRRDRIVCPLEPDQWPPAFTSWPPPDIVHLKTTSASTNSARHVAFTADQLIADAENIVATMGLRADWPNLGVISMAHSYGFSNLVLPLLLHGIPLILVGSSLPEAVRRAVDSTGPVTLPAVPALWRAWHEAGCLTPEMRLAISAGAPLAAPLEQTIFDRCGLKVHNFYGATECGGIAFDGSPAPRCEDRFVGTPMQGVDVEVGEDGCLQVHSRAVGATYWPEPEAELDEGCFRTSDLAEIKDGRVFLLGRVGDIINVAGRKVAPETIERVLRTHPEIRECLVFGAPSHEPDRAEIIVACVAAQALGDRETLKQFLLERLPAWQVPRDWWFMPELKSNPRGKLSRAEWRRRYLEAANIPKHPIDTKP